MTRGKGEAGRQGRMTQGCLCSLNSTPAQHRPMTRIEGSVGETRNDLTMEEGRGEKGEKRKWAASCLICLPGSGPSCIPQAATAPLAGQDPSRSLSAQRRVSDWACSLYKPEAAHPFQIPRRGPAPFGASGKTCCPFSLSPWPGGVQTLSELLLPG